MERPVWPDSFSCAEEGGGTAELRQRYGSVYRTRVMFDHFSRAQTGVFGLKLQCF